MLKKEFKRYNGQRELLVGAKKKLDFGVVKICSMFTIVLIVVELVPKCDFVKLKSWLTFVKFM